MSSFARQADLSEDVRSLLTVIHGEAELGCSAAAAKSHCSSDTGRQLPDNDDAEEDAAEDAPARKRLRGSNSSRTSDDTAEPRRPVNTESGLSGDTSAAQLCDSSSVQIDDGVETSRAVVSRYSRGPMFYYCLHRRRLKNVNLPK